jgi:hypothetical protein
LGNFLILEFKIDHEKWEGTFEALEEFISTEAGTQEILTGNQHYFTVSTSSFSTIYSLEIIRHCANYSDSLCSCINNRHHLEGQRSLGFRSVDVVQNYATFVVFRAQQQSHVLESQILELAEASWVVSLAGSSNTFAGRFE